MKTEELIAECVRRYNTQTSHETGLLAVIIAVEKAMRDDGYVQLPAEWYIAEDGDGDTTLWMPAADSAGPDVCIGYRTLSGNARVEKPIGPPIDVAAATASASSRARSSRGASAASCAGVDARRRVFCVT